jgi:hypothetical protein
MDDIVSLIKKDIINYYDNVQFEIEIEGQTKLLQMADKSNLARRMTNRLNKFLVKQVQILQTSNLTELNEYFKNDSQFLIMNKETIKSKSLTKSGFFIGNKRLKNIVKGNSQIGLFIQTDWYLSENELKYLKLRFEKMELKEKSDSHLTNVSYDLNYFNFNFNLLNENFKL